MLKLRPATVLAIIALATAGVFTFAEAQSPPARCGGPCQQCRVQLGVVTDGTKGAPWPGGDPGRTNKNEGGEPRSLQPFPSH